jgi:hypothetical protein
MGHLLIDNYNNIPEHIRNFAYSKVKLYINHATDLGGHNCMFYCLKPGLQEKYTYYCGQDSVEINWSDCKFMANKMRLL